MNAHIIQEDSKRNTETTEYIIDDGTKVIPIKNKHGDLIARVKFRTTDIGIAERAQNAQSEISDTLKSLSGVSVNPDGTADDDEGIRRLTEARERITREINGIFGDDVCTQLFKACSPFSPVGGKFFVERVATLLGTIIDDEMTKQQEELIAEYTSDLE